MVEKKLSDENDKLCLIFDGKIMKDNENLKNNNIKDGMKVNIVIKKN